VKDKDSNIFCLILCALILLSGPSSNEWGQLISSIPLHPSHLHCSLFIPCQDSSLGEITKPLFAENRKKKKRSKPKPIISIWPLPHPSLPTTHISSF
jgi:hypothetical protein